ncbi:hypothetical protein [Salinisphaera orenii]|uniref:hypothetical protein n=1 Tax=Salinisphaera orenii TaxID=856731 RepID=UPI000DBE4DB0
MDLVTQIVTIAGLVVGVARAANHLLARVAGITATTTDDQITNAAGVWIRRVQSVLDTIAVKGDNDARAAAKQSQ